MNLLGLFLYMGPKCSIEHNTQSYINKTHSSYCITNKLTSFLIHSMSTLAQSPIITIGPHLIQKEYTHAHTNKICGGRYQGKSLHNINNEPFNRVIQTSSINIPLQKPKTNINLFNIFSYLHFDILLQ